MKILHISKSYDKKISVNYQSFGFATSLSAALPKEDMTEDEIREYGHKVFLAAKQLVDDDVAVLQEDISNINKPRLGKGGNQ